MRYHIAIKETVFLPKNVVACPIHINAASWTNVSQIMESEQYDFTKEFIEDMFHLLSKPPCAIGIAKESSLYQNIKIHCVENY